MIRTYYATFIWEMSETIEVKAESEEEAREKALKIGESLDIDKEGEYVGDSFGLLNLEASDEITLTRGPFAGISGVEEPSV